MGYTTGFFHRDYEINSSLWKPKEIGIESLLLLLAQRYALYSSIKFMIEFLKVSPKPKLQPDLPPVNPKPDPRNGQCSRVVSKITEMFLFSGSWMSLVSKWVISYNLFLNGIY